MKTIGEKIKAFRKSKGMTQAALAEKAGIDRTYINNVEAGRKVPKLNAISRIANALDVHPITLLPDWFLFGGYE